MGPRDGLQNEAGQIDTAAKVAFIDRLSQTGLEVIEVTSMVNPQWVPQLADAEEVYRRIHRHQGVSYPVLVPNMEGWKRALATGVQTIAVFTAASETFNRKNTHCSIAESLERISPVLEQARSMNVTVRGYISCALGCPYEGDIEPHRVADLAARLNRLGCDEIALGDTIGIGTPLQAKSLVKSVAEQVPLERLAIHFHDTYGQALANILACLELGVSVVDSSVAGLGGCPYAPGASGNVATEDVLYMLHGMNIHTGVDLAALSKIGRAICAQLGRDNHSHVGRALMSGKR